MMEKQKKVVLITGCSTGLGRALAKVWHERGDMVYASARRIESLASLAQLGMHTLKMDVTNLRDIEKVMQKLQEEQGRLDILVNNAGYAAIGPVVELPIDELRRQFETNVIAPIALTQAALPLLRRAQDSVVIQIGSVSATLVSPFAGAYCASKAALHALSDALRMELAPFGIRVIIVAAGAIRSNFGDAAEKNLRHSLKPNSIYQLIEKTIQYRARASQNNPSPAEWLAQKIVAAAAQKRFKTIYRIGKGARAMFFLKRLLPEKTLDKILKIKFNLNQPLAMLSTRIFI